MAQASLGRRHGPATRYWKPACGALVVVAFAAALALLPVREWIEAVERWVEAHGMLGTAVFVVAYVVATVAMVPTWFFTVVAGAVFGVLGGLPLVVVAALAGAVLAFLLSRHALRARIEKRFAGHRVLAAVDRAVRQRAFRVVLLVRMSPLIPFGAQNYFLGLTHVSLARYVAATTIGIVPETVLYLFIGATGREALAGGSLVKWGLVAAGIAASIAVAWIVTRATRKELGLRAED